MTLMKVVMCDRNRSENNCILNDDSFFISVGVKSISSARLIISGGLNSHMTGEQID